MAQVEIPLAIHTLFIDTEVRSAHHVGPSVCRHRQTWPCERVAEELSRASIRRDNEIVEAFHGALADHVVQTHQRSISFHTLPLPRPSLRLVNALGAPQLPLHNSAEEIAMLDKMIEVDDDAGII